MNLTAQLYEITKNLTVLCVEDNTELLAQMKNILDQLFKKTDTAENGQLGLDTFKKKLKDDDSAYDIVMTDIKMPFMNGIEMVEEIYKIVPYQSIIVTSAHNDSEYLLPLLNMGVNGFLVKPLTLKSMTKTLYTTAKSIENEYLLKQQHKEMKQRNETKDKIF